MPESEYHKKSNRVFPTCYKCGQKFLTPYDLVVHHSQPCSPPPVMEPARMPIREKITEKLCRICGKVKPISQFAFYGGSTDGISGWCDECRAKKKNQKNGGVIVHAE